ncbi:MAG: hypothetical protein DDT32_01028 [Syntrophomonadaceae bacterium]|nr:hypothetical protein [Bacillota bacterium]
MTSRERVMAVLAHQEPDRTPIFEYVLQPPVADAILGRPYIYGPRLEELMREQGLEPALQQQAADMVALAKTLGHDLLYVTPNPLPPKVLAKMPAGVWEDIFSQDPVEEMTRCVEQAEKDFTPIPDEKYLIYKLLHQEMEKAGLDLPILAPAFAHGVWTNTVLMQAMVLAPEIVFRHFALATKTALALVERYVELGIEMIGVGGDFAGNRGPLISPLLYQKFIVPEVRKLSQRIHAAGKTAVNASDGNLWPVIDDFLLGCEVDGYIEIDLRAGMELPELKRKFGSKITFFGNLDCANLLSFGTPAQVKEHTKDCLRKGLGNGGHILCCNNAITESVPVANYRAIGEGYREFFGL